MIDLKQFVKETDLYLFDLDGTLYLGNRLFDFTKELLHEIKKHTKKYFFITNNSSKSAVDYVRKFAAMGVETTEDDFISSSEVTAQYLKDNYADCNFYVGGTKSLIKYFTDYGLSVTENTEKADAVVIGFDTELNFKKIDDISKILCTRDVPYIATHPDMYCPTEYGQVPDCGAMANMFFIATGKTPTVIGKPTPLMPQLAMKLTDTPPERTAVVGDRVSTDIKCGIAAGAKTVFVLSGDDDIAKAESAQIEPTVTIDDCGELLKAFKAL